MVLLRSRLHRLGDVIAVSIEIADQERAEVRRLDDLAAAIPATSGGPHHGPAGDDALSALVNLGYPRPIAQKAIETAIAKNPEAAHDFETLFRAAMAAIR